MKKPLLASSFLLCGIAIALALTIPTGASQYKKPAKRNQNSHASNSFDNEFLLAFEDAQVKKPKPKPKEAKADAPKSVDQPADEKFAIPESEKPFWESAQAFVDAYAKRDAKAIGEMFTDDAEFYDEFGERTEGRAAIVAMYQAVFDAGSDGTIDGIVIDRVRQINDTVAMEEGTVTASESADGPLFRNRYVALHTKDADGNWKINTLKDMPRESGERHEQLTPLSWMLGEWVNEDEESVVHTECDWSEDGNFLLRRFTVQMLDGREMNGVQRTGWDAHAKKLRSWTFDSEGGYISGDWTKNDNQWLLTNTGVTADGKTVSGTAVYTVIDAEMITWQLQNVIVGDQVMPDGQVVTMVRRPPEPAGATK
ncbi:MAG: YybH family protein [Planctomycetaceae bacterium]